MLQSAWHPFDHVVREVRPVTTGMQVLMTITLIYDHNTMAQALSIDILFDAAIRIQVQHDRNISVSFSERQIQVKFPTTRRLAEFLEVPHYYVLPYFAMMEQEELVTRAERVGILTTMKGTKILVGLMTTQYREDAEKILGQELFNDIINALSRYGDPRLPSDCNAHVNTV